MAPLEKGFSGRGNPFSFPSLAGLFIGMRLMGNCQFLGIFSLKQGFNGCRLHPCASFHYGHVSPCISNGHQPSQYEMRPGTQCQV